MAGSDTAHAGRRAGGLSLVRCGKRTNFGGGLGEREAKRSLPQLARVGSADRKSAGNSCGFEDLGRFNLWRPTVVDRMRGSKWNRALPGGGLGEREAKRSLPQLARVGSADLSFPENTGKPKKSAASIYGGWFRVLSGGSMWLSVLPTRGSR